MGFETEVFENVNNVLAKRGNPNIEIGTKVRVKGDKYPAPVYVVREVELVYVVGHLPLMYYHLELLTPSCTLDRFRTVPAYDVYQAYDDNFINEPPFPGYAYKRKQSYPTYNFISIPLVKKIIFNDPATIILWADGTKTVVKCSEGDEYDPEKGLAFCYMKKIFGNNYYKNIRNQIKEYDIISEEKYQTVMEQARKCIMEGLTKITEAENG